MVTLAEHYDAYPYPERDPAEERRRLITGSPSHPLEIDHALWGGRRDWSRPLRALVAGGGTGDGLIQLAQVLKSAGAPTEITYLDLSASARADAEERARVRGLRHRVPHRIAARGRGARALRLHRLLRRAAPSAPIPRRGSAALRAALAPGGGMGLMVYAPYGRSGVYPLQEAFGAILGGLAPQERLRRGEGDHGRRCRRAIRSGRNPNLVDHAAADAGFYDLLLHGRTGPTA